MSAPTPEDLTRKNALTGLAVMVVVVGMVGLSFAAVPLYNLFCAVTGFGGTTQVSTAIPGEVLERKVTVNFNADTGRNLNWDFWPEKRSIEVQIGRRAIANYIAHSNASVPTAGTAIYNVTPLKAGKYFHKIQCFCFDEQILQPEEAVSMPVLFFVDPAMDKDPNMDDVQTITLSYTFFRAESKELEEALDAFYNDDGANNQSTQ